jgi:hypothetical protein
MLIEKKFFGYSFHLGRKTAYASNNVKTSWQNLQEKKPNKPTVHE